MADSGIAVLDSMIERLKVLAGPTMPTRVATKAAPVVDAAIKKTAAAGTTPSGQAWKPKKDGGKPLVNAASHITTSAAGNYVRVKLTGPDVFHQKGLQGKPVRRVIPDSGTIPEGVKTALLHAAKEVFVEITGVRQ